MKERVNKSFRSRVVKMFSVLGSVHVSVKILTEFSVFRLALCVSPGCG